MSDDSQTKMKVELDFLCALERGEVVTQMALKERVGVSVGLINALLKRSMAKGYVKARQAPYKRYAYYLTPKGFTEKSRLVAAYLENSMDFLRTARLEYVKIIAECIASGKTKPLIAGSGELLEIALLAAFHKKDLAFTVFDLSAEQDYATDFDVIIIADSKNAQDTFEGLRYKYPDKEILWPSFLQITPDRRDLIRNQGGQTD